MAMIFGIQLLSTLIVGLFMSKLFSVYSYSLLIFYNTWFSVPPVPEYLGEFSQAYKDHMKRKPRNGEKKEPLGDFTIPKDSDLKISSNRIISYIQIRLLPNGSDIDMIVLLSISSILVYMVTELSLYFNLSAVTDLHLSYIWSVIGIVYCVKFLGYMLKVYICLGGGERSLCGLSVFLFIVFALLISMTDKKTIDFGVDEGYSEFSEEFLKFANRSNLLKGKQEVVLPSVKAFKGFLIVTSGIIGALLTFPSFRYGALNSKILLKSSSSPGDEDEKLKSSTLSGGLTQVIVHFNLLAPLLVVVAWCKPLVQDHIQSQTNISDAQFDMLRVGVIAVIVLVRLCSIRLYLQTHLNTAKDYLGNLKREAGRIDHKIIQQKVAYIFQYSSIVVLQILTPALILLQLCLLLLSLQNTPDDVTELMTSAPSRSLLTGVTDIIPEVVSKADVSVFQGFRCVLTKKFLASLCSYYTWWVVSASAGVTMFSTVYHHVSETV